MDNPGLFFFSFGLFQTNITIVTTNYNVNRSTQYVVLGFEPMTFSTMRLLT